MSVEVKWYILKEDENEFSYQIYDGIHFLDTINLTDRFCAFEFELKFSLLITQHRIPDTSYLKCQDIDILKPLLNLQETYEKKKHSITLQRFGIPICRVKQISLQELLSGALADTSD